MSKMLSSIRITSSLSTALFIAVFSACTKQAAPTSQTDATAEESKVVTQKSVERLNKTLKEYVDSGKIAGVSALVFEKGEEVYFNAFGYADREAQVPMTRDTIIRIYSMTKPITGVALMSLHEQGKFKLDDSLSDYLPQFKNQQVCTGLAEDGSMILEDPKRPISIRDITRHTAGFPGGNNVCVGEAIRSSTIFDFQNTLTDVADGVASFPLGFHPGEKWSYGVSVDIQAHLVEKFSGQSFKQYMQDTILSPLGMKHTRYQVPVDERSNFSALYQLAEDGALQQLPEAENDINTSDATLTPGGWGLTSTLDDYARFARMLVNEGKLDGVQILKPETVRMMASNHLEDSVTDRMWLPSKGDVGFGIDFAVRIREATESSEKYGVLGEFFWDGAASPMFWVDPKNDIVALMFVQIFPFDNNLHKVFREAVYDVPAPQSAIKAN